MFKIVDHEYTGDINRGTEPSIYQFLRIEIGYYRDGPISSWIPLPNWLELINTQPDKPL